MVAMHLLFMGTLMFVRRQTHDDIRRAVYITVYKLRMISSIPKHVHVIYWDHNISKASLNALVNQTPHYPPPRPMRDFDKGID